MATHANSTPTPLSSLFQSPRLRAAFERAERDDGAATADLPRPIAPLLGGTFVLPKSGLRLKKVGLDRLAKKPRKPFADHRSTLKAAATTRRMTELPTQVTDRAASEGSRVRGAHPTSPSSQSYPTLHVECDEARVEGPSLRMTFGEDWPLVTSVR